MEKANEIIMDRISQCQNPNIKVTREFLNLIREALEIQEILSKDGVEKIETKIYLKL